MKNCKGCNTDKRESEFHRHSNRADGLQVYCKLCKSLRSSNSFKSKPELRALQVERNRFNRTANRDYVRAFKEKSGCMFCSEDPPSALDLHHIDPTVKDSAVSQMLYNCKEKIDKEIAKCVVLCSNCHRKHHAGVEGYEIMAL